MSAELTGQPRGVTLPWPAACVVNPLIMPAVHVTALRFVPVPTATRGVLPHRLHSDPCLACRDLAGRLLQLLRSALVPDTSRHAGGAAAAPAASGDADNAGPGDALGGSGARRAARQRKAEGGGCVLRACQPLLQLRAGLQELLGEEGQAEPSFGSYASAGSGSGDEGSDAGTSSRRGSSSSEEGSGADSGSSSDGSSEDEGEADDGAAAGQQGRQSQARTTPLARQMKGGMQVGPRKALLPPPCLADPLPPLLYRPAPAAGMAPAHCEYITRTPLLSWLAHNPGCSLLCSWSARRPAQRGGPGAAEQGWRRWQHRCRARPWTRQQVGARACQDAACLGQFGT